MPKRICLIDDERDFTELTKALFEFQGFEAHTQNNPVEALDFVQKDNFDALIVDLMMPDMDGITLIKKIRENPTYASTPIFILSAKKLNDEERKTLLTHNTHFISKPFEPRRLVDLVKANIGE